MDKLCRLIVFLALVYSVQCAKILGLFQVPSVSHQVVFQPIWKELSLRGHNVTIITTNPLNDPSLVNLTEIDVGPPLYERMDSLADLVASKPSHWLLNSVFFLRVDKYADSVFSNPQVAALFNDPSQQFDLVLAEYSMPLGGMLAAKYKCPLVGVTSTLVANDVLGPIGIPTHPILYPDSVAPYGEHFTDRVMAVVHSVFTLALHTFAVIPKFDRTMRQHFGEDLPYYGDVQKNVSLLLLTTNPVIHGARPYGPNVVRLAKLHIRPSKPLPADLQEYLDNSDKVVYFSLGSNVKSAHLNKNKIQTVLKALSELPYKFLWKYEKDDLENVPPNVIISKWFLQQDILHHPNIKLFITQGGLQSTEEGIINRVPMLAIPFIFDQYFNARRIAKLGIGEFLEFDDLTEETLKNSITKIIENPQYKEAISEVAEVLTDDHVNDLEEAMFWIEYVIRHKGAKYLRSPAADVTWFSFLLLDVIAFLLVVSLALTFVSYKLISCTLRCISNRSCKKQIKKKLS